MPKSDSLFLLIKSLLPAEKRYFKLYSNKHVIGEQNNYVRLFDAINSMEHYSETDLRSILLHRFPGEKFVNHLASEKSRLFKIILQSLRSYRSEKSISRKLIDMIEDAQILTNKKLYDQAAKVLTKAEDLARRHEDFLILFRVQELMRTQIQVNESSNIRKRILEVISQSDDTCKRLFNQIQIQNLYDLTYHIARTNFSTSVQDSLEEIAEIESQSVLASAENALSISAKLRYHATHAIIGKMKNNIQTVYEHWEQSLELLKENPIRMQEEIRQYIIVTANFVNVCIQMREYEQIAEIVMSFKDLRDLSPETSTELTHNIFHIELLSSLNSGRLEKALEIAPEIFSWLESNAGVVNTSRVITMYYNLAVLHFLESDFSAAEICFQKVIDFNKAEVRQDLQSSARLLLPLAMFSCGKSDILESYVRSAHYYLESRKSMQKFEQLMITCLRGLERCGDHDRCSETIIDSAKSLAELFKNNQQTLRPGMKEAHYWLQAQLKKISIKSIYLEDLKNH